MFTQLLGLLFGKFRVKKIAFIDGDQDINGALKAYDKFVKGTGAEAHFIRLKNSNHKEPKVIARRDDINRIYLDGRAGKEVVDKFISGYIQRAVSEGYSEITVISNDYDFIDIFKMAVQINTAAAAVTFRMVIPRGVGRMATTESPVANIEIVRM